jgi:hypothetical protein
MLPKVRRAHSRLMFMCLVAPLLMTACSRYFDALITNPCPGAVEVGFWAGRAPTPDESASIVFHEIPAHVSEFRVNDSVAAPEGWPGGFAVLRAGSIYRLLVVPPTDSDPVRVEIPDDLCSALAA